jgi:hypothetical protein
MNKRVQFFWSKASFLLLIAWSFSFVAILGGHANAKSLAYAMPVAERTFPRG